MLPMMDGAASAIAAVACLAICFAAVLRRQDAERRHATRLGQLKKAAELFEVHARHLAAFLDDPAAPRPLKVMLLRFTEFMRERKAVASFAKWMAEQPLEAPDIDADTQELLRVLDSLRQSRPDLVTALSSAIVCGAFGAMLRWPEAAQFFDLSGTNMVADDRREVAAAVCAAKMQSPQLFDFGVRQTAMA
jgi:hypothetical protein